MKFTSQIATTPKQSKRLLELGLKPESADCMYSVMIVSYNGYFIEEDKRNYHLCLFYQDEVQAVGFCKYEKIPAWSLHRLIELYKDVEDTSMWSLDCITYNRLIQCISLAIKHGAFNKDYLEEI